MSRRVHVLVVGQLDMASQVQRGTLTIDREIGMINVRPLRRRRTYDLPLDFVAGWICRRVLMAELAEKRALKRKKRGANK